MDHKIKTFWNFYCNHFSIHIIFLRGKSHFKWPFLKMTGSKLSPYMQSLAASKWCFSVLKCNDIFQISDAQCALHTFFIPRFKINIIISSVKFLRCLFVVHFVISFTTITFHPDVSPVTEIVWKELTNHFCHMLSILTINN